MSDDKCVIPECGKPRRYRHNGLCVMHNSRLQRTGTTDPRPSNKRTIDCPTCGTRFQTWEKKYCSHECYAQSLRTDVPTYRTLHTWLTRQRGPASSHECVACGDTAQHWAFDNRTDMLGTLFCPTTGFPYSTNLNRYVPKCLPCHMAERRADTCRRGHPRTPENTYIRKDNGGRQCRECQRVRRGLAVA